MRQLTSGPFNDRDPKTDKVFTVLFDITLGGSPANAGTTAPSVRVREYLFDAKAVANGGVAQNGGYFLAINYARMARLRTVTAYQGSRDWTAVVAAPAVDGIARTVLAPHR